MSVAKSGKYVSRFAAVFLTMVVFISCFCTTLVVHAEDNEDEMENYSYANAAALINAAFTYDSGASSDGGFAYSISGDKSTASALVGYSDTKVMEGKGIFGWLIAHSTLASASYSYAFYKTGSFGDGIADYFKLGAALGQTGLDQTVYIDPLGNLARLIGGALMLLAYLFAYSVNLIFQVVVKILLFINPFQLFSKSNANTFLKTALAYEPGSTTDNSMAAIADTVSSIYDAIYNLSWAAIVPFLIVMLLLSILVFSPGDPNKRRHNIKKFLIRIAFIGLGIPIIGILYTSCLEKMAEELETGNGANSATYIIMSTFCDFEGWCINSHMDTNGIEYDCTWSASSGYEITAKTEAMIRYSCLQMNAKVCDIDVGKYSYEGAGSVNVNSGSKNATSTVYRAYANMIQSGSDGAKIDDTCYSMLLRYMCSYTYEAATYESNDKITIASSYSPSQVFKPFKSYDTFTNSDNGTWSKIKSVYAGQVPNHEIALVLPDSKGSGLSRLGVFNYLSTSFGTTGCSVFSTDASSALVRQSHRSVNVCGSSGFMRFMFWISGIITLVCLGIIGYGYCFGILFSNLKRGFQVILNAAMGTLGSISAAAQFVTNSIIMIVEVFATFLIYSLISELVFALPDMIVGLVINYIT